MIKCGKCKELIQGKNFGVFDASTFVDLCSLACRVDFKETARRRRSGDADPGVTAAAKTSRPRKLSPAEIRKRARPTETDISKSIESQLIAAGLWNTRTQSGSIPIGKNFMQLCRPGTPDRIFAAGLHVWIEVKREGEKPMPIQAATHEQLKANGALVFVLDDPGDLSFILETLKTSADRLERIRKEIGILQIYCDAALRHGREQKK